MSDLARRLARVEAQMTQQADRLAWAAVHAARSRQGARARLAIGHRLGMDANDPRLVDAVTLLAGDTPAQADYDAETIARGRGQHGIPDESGGARERLAKRLEDMACRLAAQHDRRAVGDRGRGHPTRRGTNSGVHR